MLMLIADADAVFISKVVSNHKNGIITTQTTQSPARNHPSLCSPHPPPPPPRLAVRQPPLIKWWMITATIDKKMKAMKEPKKIASPTCSNIC